MTRILGTYKLKYPIIRETRSAETGEVSEETLREAGFCVVLKRPRGKDMRVMDQYEGREISGSIALIAKITNLSEEEAELLDGEDIGELGNLLGKNAPGGQTTGEPA
ncbi:phage tail assembly protein [Novosphingobium clariflavum]|uniref:Phage tail assembly protein n=1 Tax=Novosphingobium clariflavum TaxID=2029884 RepID=A0ABV6SAX4_9SPHN|nr:phage tail assembly protein [Novosphingobium clariflavum]